MRPLEAQCRLELGSLQTLTPVKRREQRVTAIRMFREPWNKGKLIGQKAPLKLKDIWAIRVRLQLANGARDFGVVQSGNRQQAQGMRPCCQTSSSGCLRW